jgi:repressor LexA
MGWDTPRYGKRLIEARKANRKDQKELAEETGISVSKLAKFESDVAEPTMEELTLIAQAYGLPLSEFLWKDFGEKTHIISNASPLPADKIHMIPIFESVSAGFGAYACSDVIDYMPLYIQNRSDVPDMLCIKVTGDSMYPKIEDGDIIVVRRQDSVDSGSIAVVLVDEDQGYVKKVIYDEKTIELHSINPEYAPKIFRGAEVLRVRVVGIVKQVIKTL